MTLALRFNLKLGSNLYNSVKEWKKNLLLMLLDTRTLLHNVFATFLGCWGHIMPYLYMDQLGITNLRWLMVRHFYSAVWSIYPIPLSSQRLWLLNVMLLIVIGGLDVQRNLWSWSIFFHLVFSNLIWNLS